MKPEEARKVAVIGAGAMGHGIAEVAAIAGLEVSLHDRDPNVLQEALGTIRGHLDGLVHDARLTHEQIAPILDRLKSTSELASAIEGADVVIEAIPERLPLKLALFAELERRSPATVILASNTSSIAITDIAKELRHADRVVGLHFFTPPIRLPMVEVVKGERTSEATMEFMLGFARRLRKEPIRVDKDVRGFVVNRCLIGPYLEEPAWAVSRGEATIEAIDSRMKHYEGLPFGPFEVLDIVGCDVVQDVLRTHGLPVPPVIAETIAKGDLGQKTGKGFYEYRCGRPQISRGPGESYDPIGVYAVMINQAAWLFGGGVAELATIDRAALRVLGMPEGISHLAGRIGNQRVESELQRLSKAYGLEQYQPAEWLSSVLIGCMVGVAAQGVDWSPKRGDFAPPASGGR